MQNGNNPPYLQLEPTVQTEIVTTTKRTIINYPQIPIMRPKSPQQVFSLNTKKYPLSRAPLPPETANFTFNLPDGHKATYNSNESTVDNKGKCKLLDDCHPKKKLKEDDIPISGPLRSPLPSPHASPRNDSTSDSSTITIDSDSPPNLGESSTMPVLLSIPHLMSIYPTLPSETQSHLLLHLLRLSSINTIRQVNNFIRPALQKDFLSQLPPELASLILSYLNLRELTRSASVNKTWRRIVDNDRCAWKLAGIKEGLWFGDEDSIATARHEALTITNKISTKNHNSNYDNNDDVSSNEDNCSTDAPRTPLTPPPISNTSGNIVSPARSSFMARCHPYKQILRKRYVVRNNWFYQDPKSFEFARHGQNVVTCLQFDSDKVSITNSF